MYNEHNKGFISAQEAAHLLTDPNLTTHASPRRVAEVVAYLNGMKLTAQDAGVLAQLVDAHQVRTKRQQIEVLEAGFAKGTAGFAKAGDNIGTQLQGQAFTSESPNPGSTFAPFIPQSISQKALDVTLNPAKAWLLNYLPKRRVNGLVHETAVLTGTTNRPAQRSFLAESGTGSSSQLQAARTAVTIRCEYMQTSVSIAGAYAGMLTPSGYVPRAGMEVAQATLMRALLQRRAQNVWTANSAVDPLSYDGFLAATLSPSYTAGRLSYGAASTQWTNLDGAHIDFPTLLSILNEKNAAQNGQQFTIGKIAMLPQAVNFLQQQYETTVRNNQNVPGVKFYNDKLTIQPIIGPAVEIVPDPSISIWQRSAASTYQGTNPGTLGDTTPTPVAAPSAYSKFGAGDAGDYIYRVIGIAATGETVPFVCDTVTVAAGDSVTITLQDSGIQGADGVVYWWVERSTVNGAVGTTKLIGFWPTPYTQSGSASNTVIIDDNLTRTDCSPVGFFADEEIQVNEWCDFVDPLMFPLGPTGASSPFMIVSFGSPNWIQPQANYAALNAKFG